MVLCNLASELRQWVLNFFLCNVVVLCISHVHVLLISFARDCNDVAHQAADHRFKFRDVTGSNLENVFPDVSEPSPEPGNFRFVLLVEEIDFKQNYKNELWRTYWLLI